MLQFNRHRASTCRQHAGVRQRHVVEHGALNTQAVDTATRADFASGSHTTVTMSLQGTQRLVDDRPRVVGGVVTFLGPEERGPDLAGLPTGVPRLRVEVDDVSDPVASDSMPFSLDHAAGLFDFAKDLNPGAGQLILVHCRSGVSRSAAAAAALHAQWGASPEEAIRASLASHGASHLTHGDEPRSWWPNALVLARCSLVLYGDRRLLAAYVDHHRELGREPWPRWLHLLDCEL
jgi:rhodanese-related sulfurtransferase